MKDCLVQAIQNSLKLKLFKSALHVCVWTKNTDIGKHTNFKDDFQSILRSLRTLMFVNIINGSLDGMRIDVMNSLRTTYLVFETFQILFPTASLIFTAVKLFHEVIWERTKY